MLSLPALLDLSHAWWALSPEGRHWMAGLRHSPAAGRGSGFSEVLNDPLRRRSLLRSLRAADEAFRDHVPADLCRRAGREPRDVYRRYLPFAWINIEIRARILDAFQLECDAGGYTRLALIFFSTREMNDLQDHLPRAQLLPIAGGRATPPPECALLFHLGEVSRRLIPPADFPKLYELYRQWQTAPYAGPDPQPELARDHLAEKSHTGTLSGLYAVLRDVPDAVSEALRPFSLWLYELDEFTDLERDRASGRRSYLGSLADPEAEFRTTLERAADALRAAAPQPDRLIGLMRFMSDKAIDARRTGRDLERDFLFARE